MGEPEFEWYFTDRRGKKEIAYVWRHGVNDYAVYYAEEDYSLRGSFVEIMFDLVERGVML